MNPDTSAQDVASQEAEAREAVLKAYDESGSSPTFETDEAYDAAFFAALDAYAAVIRASERERYAALDIPSPEECICQEAIKARGLVELDCGYHMYEDLFTALRALAGQSEEVTG